MEKDQEIHFIKFDLTEDLPYLENVNLVTVFNISSSDLGELCNINHLSLESRQDLYSKMFLSR